MRQFSSIRKIMILLSLLFISYFAFLVIMNELHFIPQKLEIIKTGEFISGVMERFPEIQNDPKDNGNNIWFSGMITGYDFLIMRITYKTDITTDKEGRIKHVDIKKGNEIIFYDCFQ